MQLTRTTTKGTRRRRRSGADDGGVPVIIERHDYTSCCIDDNDAGFAGKTLPLHKQKTKSSLSSMGPLSILTVSTEDTDEDELSEFSLSEDIPLEVVIINDDYGAVGGGKKIPSSTQGGHDDNVAFDQEEMDRRLQMYESVISSYKHKLKSSENLNQNLEKFLKQTQGYAENLLSDRQELITVIEDIEKEDNLRVDQDLMMKFILCSSLLFNLFGGSHLFLTGAVVLQLIVTIVNIAI
jgi:hypothetical protein